MNLIFYGVAVRATGLKLWENVATILRRPGEPWNPPNQPKNKKILCFWLCQKKIGSVKSQKNSGIANFFGSAKSQKNIWLCQKKS